MSWSLGFLGCFLGKASWFRTQIRWSSYHAISFSAFGRWDVRLRFHAAERNELWVTNVTAELNFEMTGKVVAIEVKLLRMGLVLRRVLSDTENR